MVDIITNADKVEQILGDAVESSRRNSDGKQANYIPELESFPPEYTSACIRMLDNTEYYAGDSTEQKLTLQSVSKLVVFLGILEEQGPATVATMVRSEPSGDDFASVARLDQFGPVPSNPMLNAGAIALCSAIPGNVEDKLTWLDNWMAKLFNSNLHSNVKVFASERRTGDRNRALAYLLKSNGILGDDIETALDTYFHLCSFEATTSQASYFSMLLANLGRSPDGEQIFSRQTALQVISVMATCGLYNESGRHLVRTGMPAKSGVSGMIIACVPGVAGIAVASPRVNRKGTSIRGELILESLSNELGWHFANVLSSR